MMLVRALVLLHFVAYLVTLPPHLVHHLFEHDAADTDDCAFAEKCIQGTQPGWRRLLQFATADHKRNMHSVSRRNSYSCAKSMRSAFIVAIVLGMRTFS